MMRMKLYVLCVVLMLHGCQYNTGYVADWQIEKTIDLNKLDADVIPSYDILSVSKEFLHAKDFWIYQDTVLVVLNKPTTDYMIELYDIKSGTMLTRKIRRGNGPIEMLNCNARMDADDFYVRDFVKGNYTVINLKELVKYKDEYQLEPFRKYKERLNVYDIHEFGDKLLVLNPYCFSSPDIGVDNREPRFFYDDEWRPDNRKPNAFNVSQGHILVNEKEEKILFAGLDLSQIEIYDYSLAQLIKITGPKQINARYSFRDGQVSFSEKAYYNYMGACNVGDSFYVTYSGKDITQANATYIFQFDWEGNILRAYFVDKYLATMSSSSDGKTLYIRGKDDEGLVVLYRFDI